MNGPWISFATILQTQCNGVGEHTFAHFRVCYSRALVLGERLPRTDRILHTEAWIKKRGISLNYLGDVHQAILIDEWTLDRSSVEMQYGHSPSYKAAILLRREPRSGTMSANWSNLIGTSAVRA